MCSTLISQNLGESEEVKRSKCWEMKDQIDKLVSEQISTKLIIKLLQEDIHLSSPSTKSQANLTWDRTLKSYFIVTKRRVIHGKR
jgi:hypothetical protein